MRSVRIRRRRQSEIRVHAARVDFKYKCPKCGNIHTRSYELREKTVDGVPDAFIPVKIIVTVHRLYTGPAEKKFMTVVRDAKTGDVLYIGDGKGVKALKAFEKRLRHWRGRIKYVCMDMSNSYAKWVKDFLGEKTDIVYDHFHLIKAMNDRLDKVRRRTMNKLGGEYKKIIKGQRFTLKKNMEKLDEKERGHLDEMRSTFSELSDVHSMKEQLRGIYTFAEYETGARWLLEDWCETARMTAVPELVTMAQTIADHMEGILGY